jgi:hypothetical protein
MYFKIKFLAESSKFYLISSNRQSDSPVFWSNVRKNHFVYGNQTVTFNTIDDARNYGINLGLKEVKEIY